MYKTWDRFKSQPEKILLTKYPSFKNPVFQKPVKKPIYFFHKGKV